MFDEVGRHPGICTATSREQLAAEEALILKQCGLACSTMCGLWRYETYQLPSWGPATCCSAWRRWGFAAPTCTYTKASQLQHGRERTACASHSSPADSRPRDLREGRCSGRRGQ